MRVCPRCHGRYDGEPRFCPRDGAPLAADEDPRLGQVLFGQFELREVCGKGAMGTVYRAWQTGMERQVAVKVLRSELLREPAVVKRFFREARSVARMQHPNIVTVFLVGETDDRMPYIVMEYVEGVALAEVATAEGALDPPRALRIGRQIASALADAHSVGIVHRDLKPANILLTQRRRASDFVKVLDFGIAKVLHGDEVEQGALSHLTRTGTIFGTPHYIAPEQAQGGDIDHRADLYSLGVIMYRLLVGRLPFEGTGIAVLLQHMNQAPPRPREVKPELDERIEAFLLRALAKQPDERFQSAEEMSDAIDALMPAQWAAWTSSLPVAVPRESGREIGGRTVPGIMPAKREGKEVRPTVAAKRSRVSARGSGAQEAVASEEAMAAGGHADASPGPSGSFFARGEAEEQGAGASQDAPMYLDDGPSGWEYPKKRRGPAVALIVGVLAAALAVAGGYLLGRSRAPRQAEAAPVAAAPTPVAVDSGPAKPSAVAPPTDAAGPASGAPESVVDGQRLLTLGEAGYAIRVTLPAELVVGREQELVFEVRDPKGKPLAGKTVAAALEEPDGVNRTISLRGVAAGRFVLRRKFTAEGHYHVHVYPVAGKTSPRVWFDILVGAAAPSEKRGSGEAAVPSSVTPSPMPAITFPVTPAIPLPAAPDKSKPEPVDHGKPSGDPPDTSQPGPTIVDPPPPRDKPDEPDPPPDPEPDPYRIIEETPAGRPDAGFLE